MKRIAEYVIFTGILLFAGAASFFAVLRFVPTPMHGGIPSGTTMEELASAIKDLSTCRQPAPCSREAALVDTLLERANKDTFAFFSPGRFDTYIANGLVVLRRRPCAKSDIAGKVVAWSLWTASSRALSQQQERDGEFGRFQPFDTDGHTVGESCLMAIQLPRADIRRLFVSVLEDSRTKMVWKVDYRP